MSERWNIDESVKGLAHWSADDSFWTAPTFTLANRLFRLLFAVSWLLLCRWTPVPLHAWRAIVLRAFGAKLAAGVAIYPDVRIWHPANLEMGEAATLGPRVNCYAMARIVLGRRAIVSQGAHLCAGSHDIDDPRFPLVARPIVVGERAWVAAEAFVGPGVSIGDGAVLGARGVTMKSLEPWSVYAGNPARKLRDRRPG